MEEENKQEVIIQDKSNAEKFRDIHNEKHKIAQSNLGKIGYIIWNNQQSKTSK